MQLRAIDLLPHSDPQEATGWTLWQVDVVRQLISATVGLPHSQIIDGCRVDRGEDWPTCPGDHDPPDSLGIFYEDGDDEEAAYWAGVCNVILRLLKRAADWSSIRPTHFQQVANRPDLLRRRPLGFQGRS